VFAQQVPKQKAKLENQHKPEKLKMTTAKEAMILCLNS
jgi:hypothetical protein